MINPTEVNPLSLPSVKLENKSDLPTTPSIYFAIDSQGTIQYIGRSINPRTRWRGHHRESQLLELGSVKIAYLDCPSKFLNSVEVALIGHFNPPLNGTSISTEPDNKPKVDGQRKQRSFSLDQRILDALPALAKKNNQKSVNQCVENYLMVLCKASGLLLLDVQPLGEQRGGAHMSSKDTD